MAVVQRLKTRHDALSRLWFWNFGFGHMRSNLSVRAVATSTLHVASWLAAVPWAGPLPLEDPPPGVRERNMKSESDKLL